MDQTEGARKAEWKRYAKEKIKESAKRTTNGEKKIFE